MNAMEKLNKEAKTAKLSGPAKAMQEAVLQALTEFCSQSEEFARAVEQGGSFADCMKAVAKGVGRSISDLDAYKRAVNFYFQGADVRFKMEILMSKYDAEPAQEPERTTIIDLTDFL